MSGGRSKSSLWSFWSDYKDVAHLVTATVALAAEARRRTEAEQWGLEPVQLQPYRIAMVVPEAIVALGRAYQDYGLSAQVYGQDEPPLTPADVWRIPDEINVESVNPPARPVRPEYLAVLRERQAKPRPK